MSFNKITLMSIHFNNICSINMYCAATKLQHSVNSSSVNINNDLWFYLRTFNSSILKSVKKALIDALIRLSIWHDPLVSPRNVPKYFTHLLILRFVLFICHVGCVVRIMYLERKSNADGYVITNIILCIA